MNTFEYVNAVSAGNAVELLSSGADAVCMAGGTDLLTRIKPGIAKPGRVVNLKTIPEFDFIKAEAGGLRIRPAVTLDSLSKNENVRQKFPALVEAIRVTASPQLRNRGTIAGNLMQSQRCWYYRGEFKCWMKQGQICYAHLGENTYHIIFGGKVCHAVHPSDLAPVLTALDATVIVRGPDGTRKVPIEELFQIPPKENRQLHILKPAEIITEIFIPEPARGSKGTYLKAMDRKAWAFALAGAAIQLNMEFGKINQARVVLGGVANKPWRLLKTEELLRGRELTPELINSAAESAVEGAQPLAHNHYKIALVKGIVKEAFAKINKLAE